MKYRCEWKHRCIKREMVTNNEGKAEPFLSNEVVQWYSGDDRAIRWLAPLTKLILASQLRRTTRDWSHSCISPLTGIAPTHAFIILLYFIFYLSFFFSFLPFVLTEWFIHWDKNWKSVLLRSSYIDIFVNAGPCTFSVIFIIWSVRLPGGFIETITRKSAYEGLRDAKVEKKKTVWQSYNKILSGWLRSRTDVWLVAS